MSKDHAPGQALATTGGNAVAEYDYASFGGMGFEGTSQKDFRPSFLRVLQGSSPQLLTVDGAKPGKIIDTVTNELYDTAYFIPAMREELYLAWEPRIQGQKSDGPGFGGAYKPTDQLVLDALADIDDPWARDEAGKIILPKHPDGKHQLVRTVYFHGVQAFLDSKKMFPISVPFTSTSLTTAETWFTTMYRERVPTTGAPMPLFAHMSKLTTKKVEKGGNTWFIFVPGWANGSAAQSLLDPKGIYFQAGLKVHQQFAAGEVTIDHAASGGAGDDGVKSTPADAKVPF